MGFQLLIGGNPYELVDYSSVEASTPLAAGDTSGQVGTISLTITKPDLFERFPETLQDAGYVGDPVFASLGSQMLVGRDVRLSDSHKGFTLGRVISVDDSAGATVGLTCESRLGLLNVYGVQSAPYVGTLSGAFTAYLALAGVTTDLFIDPAIALTPVVFPGWNGELWFHLKQMAAAVDADLSLVSGVILLRPIRKRIAERGRETSESFSVGGALAQFVEVYKYDNRPISNQLVYPIGGWSEEVPVINVNAGEYVEEVVELSASVSSIQQPVMQTFVGPSHRTSSVYTIVGDDGLPVTPAAWNGAGGSLSVVINPDTTSLTVRVRAPRGRLPNKDGGAIGVYSVSLSSTDSTGRYSTLRIIGSGVAFSKELTRFPTGVSADRTGTEVGVTIDNPFLSTTDQLYRAGTRAAGQFRGTTLTSAAEVLSINRLGDSGIATYPEYGFVQDMHQGKTYAQVKAGYIGKSYAAVQSDLFDLVRNDFDNQVFGNIAGARIYNTRLRRWFRVREGTASPSRLSIQADDDLLHSDVKKKYESLSYAQEREIFSGLTYRDRYLAGLYLPPQVAPPVFPQVFPSTDLYPDTTLFPGG